MSTLLKKLNENVLKKENAREMGIELIYIA
jgi:hypothetical protein